MLCGAGNNGGDGYVLARLARLAGLAVRLAAWPACRAPRSEADAAAAAVRCLRRGREQALVPAPLARADVIVDALLGTGLDRPPTGPVADAIAAINASGGRCWRWTCHRVWMPTPARRRARWCGPTPRSAFVARKQGLYTGAARDCCGAAAFR